MKEKKKRKKRKKRKKKKKNKQKKKQIFFSPFEDNGLLFWAPDVRCERSEVVL